MITRRDMIKGCAALLALGSAALPVATKRSGWRIVPPAEVAEFERFLTINQPSPYLRPGMQVEIHGSAMPELHGRVFTIA